MNGEELLDLVRQYGVVCRLNGDESEAADALLDRIATLVAQQPVQARDRHGVPLWIHLCGRVEAFRHVEAFERVPFHGGCDHCESGYPKRDDWRPLIVGGDPAPKR